MLTNVEAIIFDLDGTLVDSMWVWRKVDEIYSEKYNISTPDNIGTILEGMSYTEVATYFRDEFKLPFSVDEIKQEWDDMTLHMYQDEVELKDSVKEFLDHLYMRNIKMGIATSSSRDHVEAVLEGRGIRKYFEYITTSCDVSAGKPAPDVYLNTAAKMNVEPSKCLAFEDVANGIMAAKSAGMKVCAVEDNSNVIHRDRLKELADYYISTFKNVLENTYEVM